MAKGWHGDFQRHREARLKGATNNMSFKNSDMSNFEKVSNNKNGSQEVFRKNGKTIYLLKNPITMRVIAYENGKEDPIIEKNFKVTESPIKAEKKAREFIKNKFNSNSKPKKEYTIDGVKYIDKTLGTMNYSEEVSKEGLDAVRRNASKVKPRGITQIELNTLGQIANDNREPTKIIPITTMHALALY